VTEALLSIARRVRTAVAAGDRMSIGTALDEVRQAADVASGEPLRLLEVAEAFLRAALGSHWGRRERLLRLFVADHGEEARVQLEAALRGRLQVEQVGTPQARAALAELVEVGALRHLDNQRLDVPPSMKGVIKEIISPVSFRLWDWVQRARAKAALEHPRDHDLQAQTLVADLGVSESEAQRHLRSFPLTTRPSGASEQQGVPTRVKGPYFTADGYKPSPGDEAGTPAGVPFESIFAARSVQDPQTGVLSLPTAEPHPAQDHVAVRSDEWVN
jgi:hypothetical protein